MLIHHRKMKEEIKILTIMISIILITSVGLISISNLTINNDNNNRSKTDNIQIQAEGKLAIIVKENGIFDDPVIEKQLYEFLSSVKKDLNLENIGVQYFNGSTLEELDAFTELLYYKNNVRYLIMIGRNLAWEKEEDWKKINHDIIYAFSCINSKLTFLKDRKLKTYSEWVVNLNNSENCPEVVAYETKDIAVSWIVAPDICNSSKTEYEINEMKKEIISNIITTYTNYHNNSGEILNSFSRSCLYIYGSDTPQSSYEDVNKRYQMPWTLVLNTDYNKVWNELKKKHLVLEYSVHGTPSGLVISQSEIDKGISVDDYNNFIKENGLPALFVDAGACGSDVFQRDCDFFSSEINYCWPTVNICNGVWAYYSIGSLDPCRAFSTTAPFLGCVARNYKNQMIVFGDITAHMI